MRHEEVVTAHIIFIEGFQDELAVVGQHLDLRVSWSVPANIVVHQDVFLFEAHLMIKIVVHILTSSLQTELQIIQLALFIFLFYFCFLIYKNLVWQETAFVFAMLLLWKMHQFYAHCILSTMIVSYLILPHNWVQTPGLCSSKVDPDRGGSATPCIVLQGVLGRVLGDPASAHAGNVWPHLIRGIACPWT